MTRIEEMLGRVTAEAIKELYGVNVERNVLSIQKTNKDFSGDFTLVVFPLTRISKKSPEVTGKEIGEYIKNKLKYIREFNVVKGFLNFETEKTYWVEFLKEAYGKEEYGLIKPQSDSKTVIVEFSSPNTNKPLHLGHIRNNLLGYSLSKILSANGYNVRMVNLVNDRGIHICKSMLAWEKWGNGETPESSGMKGDHLVGKYYVLFEKYYRQQVQDLIEKGYSKEEAEKNAPLIKEVREMLQKWEKGNEHVVILWGKLNSWVYDGFDVTYKELGISFDKIYYESGTYLSGKTLIEEGLEKGAFIRREDGSVWVDLTNEGLDEKLLLRSDGTSVYMTQDIGTAQLRFEEYNPYKMIYVVGNEQDYHFNVLKLVLLKKLQKEWAENIYHLSYGMVELPEGKMKSREGTVVDADDLMNVMRDTARKASEELGKAENLTEEEALKLYKTIGLGALKYFILKVDPKKKMLFNPQESIELNGNTGPFIQYTYARIKSLLKKASENGISWNKESAITEINQEEKDILKLLHEYPVVIKESGETYNPALIANYIYELVKSYNHFYQEIPVIKELNYDIACYRLKLSELTGRVIRSAMSLLGIDLPERM
ncbi:MAG: arginine--tRNA ligase [Bacteroidota bacterium]|nr:arginine--tRNA ligase [Bacteroidota bacterium]